MAHFSMAILVPCSLPGAAGLGPPLPSLYEQSGTEMLAPQFAELSHTIITFGRSLAPGGVAKMSMSSASTRGACTTTASATVDAISARISHHMTLWPRCVREASFAEVVRIRFLHPDTDALVERHLGAGRCIVDARADVPLRIRTERIARVGRSARDV